MTAVTPQPNTYEEARAACEEWLQYALTPTGVVRWFDTPHRSLAGFTPDEALRAGHFPEVWKVILGYLRPTFS